MPAPRLNPLIRLLICFIGVVIIDIVVKVIIEVALVTTALLRHLDYNQLQLEFGERDQILLMLLFYPPTLLWLWTCRYVFDRRSFSSLGLRQQKSGVDFLGGMLGGAAAVSFLFGLLYVTHNAAIGGLSADAFAAPGRTAGMLWFCFMAFIAVGFMEEISFRGYIFHNLAARFKSANAIAWQAALFAGIHAFNILNPIREIKAASQLPMNGLWHNEQVRGYVFDYLRAAPNLALIAVFFVACYLRMGSLWFAIGFHAAWNFFLGCIFSLPVSGLAMPQLLSVHVSDNALLTGGSFGAEGSVLLTPLICAMIYMLLRYPRHPQATLDLNLLRPATEPVTPVPAALPIAEERSSFKTRFGGGEDADPANLALFKEFAPAPPEDAALLEPRVSAPIRASFETPIEVKAPVSETIEPAVAPPTGDVETVISPVIEEPSVVVIPSEVPSPIKEAVPPPEAKPAPPKRQAPKW